MSKPINPLIAYIKKSKSNVLTDGMLERYLFGEDLEEVEAELVRDTGCLLCWVSSGFKTAFVAGNKSNVLCESCHPTK